MAAVWKKLAFIDPRVATTASSATPTPNCDTTDLFILTALAEAATFGAPTGTPTSGQKLMIKIKDNATPRALTWNAAYSGTLPAITIGSTDMYISCIYNSASSVWDCFFSKLDQQATDTILANATAGTAVPTAVAVAEQTLVGRITGGHIDDLSPTQIRTLINVADGATAGGGLTWTLITADPSPAVKDNGYLCNTTGGAFTVTLPAAPTAGDTIGFADAAGTFDTLNLTIGRNSLKIMGLEQDMTVSLKNAAFSLVYASAALGWRIA